MTLEYRRLGNSGLVVSSIGLGGNNFGRKNSPTEDIKGSEIVLKAAIAEGITLIDLADLYGSYPGQSEEIIGSLLGSDRDSIVLATKFGMDVGQLHGTHWEARGSRRYIRKAVETSLRRLQTDWIDLYQLHTPDPLTPIAETIQTLDDLVREGKIRYYGHSNLAGWQIAEAEFTARELGSQGFISAQNEYSLFKRGIETEVLPAVQQYGLGLLPFFPLANGLLTGKYTRDSAPEGSRLLVNKPALLASADWDTLEKYQQFADDRGVTMLEATFGWFLSNPSISSVIAGATKAEQIAMNASSASWRPTTEDLAAINEIFS